METPMQPKDDKRLRVGVLGCGPIAQAAHFESAAKARNTELYAICDVADDLRARMAATWAPEKAYADYAEMLADPLLDAVVIATSDAFHVRAAAMALEAGKHVLCEKPLGVAVEEVESLRAVRARSGKIVQVGHMKRFDAGIEAAKAFIDEEMGQHLAFKAWYCDSTHRYAMTDAVQPLIVSSASARRPAENPKADLRRYYMLARTVRSLFLVCRRDLRRRHRGPPRPDGRGPHGLARGLADLRRERQRPREDLQPVVLQDQRRRHLP
jgi:GFO/IDH/MocA oxidoreductase family protein